MEVGGPCNGRGGLMNRSIYTLEEEPPEPREPATARLAALYRSARRKLAGLRSQEEAAVVPRGYDDELTEADDDEGVVVEALGEGGAGSDHGWLQRTFARTAGLYRLRGYGGRVAVSVQLGFVAESIAADVAPGEPGAGDDPETAVADAAWLEAGEERRAPPSLVARMERRAIAWSHVPNVPDPMLGSQGAVGLTLPFIKFAYSVSIALSVSRSSLLRWMEHSARGPAEAPALAPPPQADEPPSPEPEWPGDAVAAPPPCPEVLAADSPPPRPTGRQQRARRPAARIVEETLGRRRL
ncbi:hypothetical protein JL721_5659 [Aureococcus anophagefferens]|nr:hypothetical protein JL721_5659 [Aureococcus anophagefferens]